MSNENDIMAMEVLSAGSNTSTSFDKRIDALPSVQASPKGGMHMKRVVCLYRVSTLGQVDPNNDLPRQRRACQEFIDKHDDWTLVDEKMEKGVSGFKLGVEKRAVLQDVRTMASLHQFDVLLVFMLDRLGRKSFETPLFLLDLLKLGIEVWSAVEGQVTANDQADMIKLFLQFWQGEGESRKTSTRVANAHRQMTEDGIWRGGAVPYGYKLEHRGRINKKNRMLYDVMIDEEQATVVQQIFRLFCEHGMGTTVLANYLNEQYPDSNKIWTQQTLRTMLRNPMYTGRLHSNDILSAPIEELRIITDEQFAFASLTLSRHIQRRYTTQRHAEDEALPVTAPSKTSVYGASLLSGILYCAHCGCRLVGGYCTKQRKNGPYYRPVYRCYNGSIKAKGCDGQSVYSAAKIEEAVCQIAHMYFASMQSAVDAVWKDQVRRQMRSTVDIKIKQLQGQIEKSVQQEKALRDEVLKSLTGDSLYDAEMLKEMLDDNKKIKTELEARLNACYTEKETENAQIQYLSEQYSHITEWAGEFDMASNESKKMILTRLIDRITVDRYYHLTITFYVTKEDFMTAVKPDDVSIVQADQMVHLL